VGNDKIDASLHVQEVCRQINTIKQVYHSGGRSRTDTPDELFDRFSHESISLPNDATTWSIQLCASYLSALTPELSEKITTDKEFEMPNLTTLTTKALQLDALRYMRHHASKCFNELVKQKDQMTALFRSINPSHNRGSSLNMSAISENSGEDTTHGELYFQQGPSLAESTMQRYNGNNGSSNSTSVNNQVATRKHPTTGLQHPYDQERDYLSRFPLGFKGCYNCGETTHFRTQDCPTANSASFDKMKFFSEMWAHKPHTKRHEDDRQSRISQVGNVNVMSRYQNNDHNHNSSTNFHNNNNGTQTTNSAQRSGENRNNGTQTTNSAQRG